MLQAIKWILGQVNISSPMVIYHQRPILHKRAKNILSLIDWHNFGADYDYTLMMWYNRFQQGWQERSNQYDERFKRMCSYDLNAGAGAFRIRDIQLWQILFSLSGVKGGIYVPHEEVHCIHLGTAYTFEYFFLAMNKQSGLFLTLLSIR